jgi:hypothetical protein
MDDSAGAQHASALVRCLSSLPKAERNHARVQEVVAAQAGLSASGGGAGTGDRSVRFDTKAQVTGGATDGATDGAIGGGGKKEKDERRRGAELEGRCVAAEAANGELAAANGSLLAALARKEQEADDAAAEHGACRDKLAAAEESLAALATQTLSSQAASSPAANEAGRDDLVPGLEMGPLEAMAYLKSRLEEAQEDTEK